MNILLHYLLKKSLYETWHGTCDKEDTQYSRHIFVCPDCMGSEDIDDETFMNLKGNYI